MGGRTAKQGREGPAAVRALREMPALQAPGISDCGAGWRPLTAGSGIEPPNRTARMFLLRGKGPGAAGWNAFDRPDELRLIGCCGR